MSAPKGYGLDAANDQPAKTLTKRTTDFIAAISPAARMEIAFFMLRATLALMGALIVMEVVL